MDRERAQDFDQELLDLYDDYAHGRLAACHVRLLAEDVEHGPAQDLRDGLHAVQGGLLFTGVREPIAQPMPCQVFDGKRLREFEIFLPGCDARHIHAAFRPGQSLIFGIE